MFRVLAIPAPLSSMAATVSRPSRTRSVTPSAGVQSKVVS